MSQYFLSRISWEKGPVIESDCIIKLWRLDSPLQYAINKDLESLSTLINHLFQIKQIEFNGETASVL